MGRAARQLNLSGVFAAALTPNRPGTLDVDYSALMDHLDFLADAKVAGICLMGSSGEFLNYSFSDRQRCVYLGSKRSRVPLLVGVSHSTLRGALELAHEAIAAGADGLLLMPPYFFPYGQREIEEFFRVFATETGDAVPIAVCNAPQLTSPIEPETMRRLMATGLFGAVVDSSGNAGYFTELLEMRREHGFTLMAGNDRLAMKAALGGAEGIVSDAAAAIPETMVRLWSEKSEALGVRLEELLGWVDRFPAPLALKRAAELRRQNAGDPGIPLNAERRRELDEFASWFKSWRDHG